MKKTASKQRTKALVAVAALAAIWASAATAAEIKPSSIRVGGARGLLGEWNLTVDTPGEPMTLILTFHDVDGKLGATIGSPTQTEPQVVKDITVSSQAYKLRYAAAFADTETAMVLIVRQLDAGTLTGSMSDDAGHLGVEVSSALETRGLGLFTARVRGVRGGKIPGRALLNISGAEIKITFGRLRTGSDDHKRLAALGDGEVFTYTGSRVTKLFAGADLTFGNTIVKAGNAGPNYPGVYSLWMKKVGDGWTLVFNRHADVWGTMHEAGEDVVEVPLKLGSTDEEVGRFIIDLEETGSGEGLLRVSWGSNTWTANFSVGG